MTLTPQAVYLENESWLRTVVRSRVDESDAVEDIMQNIALALVRQRENLREIGQLGAWLYQVAVRQVLMYRRSRGRQRNFRNRLRAAGGQPFTDAAPDPVSSVLAAEQQEAVRNAMQELEELDRQVLMLKYVDGWTYRRLAETLGVSEDTIEYRLLRARKRLRALLSTQPELSHVN